MKKPRLKRPVDWKEWLGLLIKTAMCPLIGGWVTWLSFKGIDWPAELTVIVGLLVWWFFYTPVVAWLLAPIWNSLYVPTPDLPTDDGVAVFGLCTVPELDTDLICGLAGELLQYDSADQKHPVTLAHGLPSGVEGKLEPKGEIRLRYSFEGYVSRQVKLSMFLNTPRLNYKWPRYSYYIAEDPDD